MDDDDTDEWSACFDFSSSSNIVNMEPTAFDAVSSDDDNWDDLCEDSVADSAAAKDLNDLRQLLLVPDEEKSSTFGDRSLDTTEDVVGCTLLQSLRQANKKHNKDPDRRGRRSIGKRRRTSSSSVTSLHELEIKYEALFAEESPVETKKVQFKFTGDDSSSDSDDSTSKNSKPTGKTESEIQMLERQLASSALEHFDWVRGVKYHVKVRNRLLKSGLDNLTELVYVTQVVVSLCSLLGQFDVGKDELRGTIDVLLGYIDDVNNGNNTNIEQGASLAIQEHVQCLRLRMAIIYVDAGEESSGVRELQALLVSVEAAECSLQKKSIKCMTINRYLADALLKAHALEECQNVLSTMLDADKMYRQQRKKSKKKDDIFGLLSQHSLHSLYEPTTPPSFATIVVRLAIENGNYKKALGCTDALISLLCSLPTNRQQSLDTNDVNSLTLQQAYFLKATALTHVASQACTMALPAQIDVLWNDIGAEQPCSPQSSSHSTTYTSVTDVSAAAVRFYKKAQLENDRCGNMNAALECELCTLELWMEFLFMPCMVHGATWGDMSLKHEANNNSEHNDENNDENNTNENGNKDKYGNGKVQQTNIIDTSKNKQNNTSSTSTSKSGIGTHICRGDVSRSLERCLKSTNHACLPLQIIRCHLSRAEYSIIGEDDPTTAMSYYLSARDLFLEIFVDGVSIPMIIKAPLAYSQKVVLVIRRLVRFLLCAVDSGDFQKKNLLLFDCLLLADLDFSRRTSIPLSRKQRSSGFAFYGVALDSEETIPQKQRMTPTNLTHNTHNSIWGLLHRLHISTQQFSRHQIMSVEKMKSHHTLICIEIQQIMSDIRATNRQPTLSSMEYDKLISRESEQSEQCDIMATAAAHGAPTSLLEYLRRAIYVLDVGGSAIIMYSVNINSTRVFYIGGRNTAVPYWGEIQKETGTESKVRKVRRSVQPYRHVELNSFGRRYLVILLSSNKQKVHSGNPQRQQVWDSAVKGWNRFVTSWGNEMASTVDKMCDIAEEAERKDGYVPHGFGIYDVPQLAETTGCMGCMARKQPVVPVKLRSLTKPTAPVLVIASKSVMVLPFEDIFNKDRSSSNDDGVVGRVGSDDVEGKGNSNIIHPYHHITRAMSLLSMASVTWSERKHRERLGKKQKNKNKNCMLSLSSPAAGIGASANVEANIAREPHFMSFAYATNQPRRLWLSERLRQYSTLRNVLRQLNHSTRSSTGREGSNTRKEENTPAHLPFQTPVLRHGRSLKDAAAALRKYTHLSILHVSPHSINGHDVVTWVDSTTRDRAVCYPVLLLTFADLLEMGNPLLHLLGWVQDLTLVFVPSTIFEEALEVFHSVQKVRQKCLLHDKRTQRKLMKKEKKRKKVAHQQLMMNKRELPAEWSTAASTLMSTVKVLKSQHQGMPIIVFNGPHH